MSAIPRRAFNPVASIKIQIAPWPALYAIMGGAALLIALHLLALRQGPTWTSPLLIGDHLFDLGFALVMLLYSLALGRRVARPLLGLSDDPLGEGLAALGIGLCALSLAILFAGFARLYYGVVFLAIWVAMTAWLRHELAAILRRIGEHGVRWYRSGMPTAPTLGQRLVLLMLIPTLLILAVRATVPVSPNVSGTEWDALAYHLSGPSLYLMEHRFVPLPDMPLANAPSGGDVLLIPGLLAGTDTVGKWLNLLCALLLGAATYALGRRVFAPRGAWLGALLLFNTIWLVPIMPTTMPDFAAAFLLVVGATDALAWAAGQRAPCPHSAPDIDRGPGALLGAGGKQDLLLLRAGILLGGAVSFKLTNLPILPAAALTIGIVCLVARGRLVARLPAAVRAGTMLCMGALLPLGPWLVKSLYFFGSALYPTGVAVAQEATDNGIGPAAVVIHRTPLEQTWWILSSVVTTFWQFTTPLCILLVLTPLLIRRPAGWVSVLFLLLAALTWLIFVPLWLPPRYWIGLIAVADAVMAGAAWHILAERITPRIQSAFSALLLAAGTLWLVVVPFSAPSAFWCIAVVCGEAMVALIMVGVLRQRTRTALLELPIVAYLCINSLFGVFLELRDMNNDQAIAVAQGALARDVYLSDAIGPYRAEQYANSHLPRDAHIVMVHVGLGAYLHRWYLNDWYGSRFATLQAGERERAAQIRLWCRMGIRYAIVNRGGEEGGDDPRVHPLSYFAWTRMPGLAPRVLFSANGIDVLSIQPCAAARGGS